ncbi:MAG: transporter [Bacteroidetes bacterium B1(2017)]|nr:MAG: transporter [Bacteroidetes bacterium B1(2017)]
MRPILIILLLATIASCKVGPKYERSKLAESKKAYATSTSGAISDTSSLAKWFDIYHDAALQELIKSSLENNLDMKLTVARIEEARSNAGIVKANLLPTIGYKLGAGTTDSKTNPQQAMVAIPNTYYTGALTLNWEIDLFGKIRNSKSSAVNVYMQQEELKKNLNVILVAEVADNYFLLRDLDNRLEIAERTLKSRKESLRINSERFDKGYNAEIDKLQAQMQLSAVEATIPNIKRQIVSVENGLNLLMGRSSGAITRGKKNSEQDLPLTIPSGLPSQLLERRPDIKAAEYSLQAQYDRIGVAQANRFPTLSLTAALGMASPQLTTLIGANSPYGSVAGGLLGPVFAFNQNKKRVDVERQRAMQSQAVYEKTVLQAFLEVDNSLANNMYLTQEYDARKVQVMAGKKALDLSQQRYNFGYTSYLEVLVQENSLFDAEIQESITQRQKYSALVNLYKALGGGW